MAFSIKRKSAREQAEETLDEGLEFLDAGEEEEAGRYFFRSVEIDPSYADGYNHLGNIAWRKGDWRQAENLYRKAIQLAEPEVKGTPKGQFWGILESRPYMRALHGLGLATWKNGRTDEAIGIFKRMLKLNPNDNQGVRYLMGPLFHQKGDLEEACKWYRKNGDDPHILYNHGLALFQQKKTEQAMEILMFAISSNPYVAPMLLRTRLPRRDWWHGTNWAEADCARDYVEDYGSWWAKEISSLALLDLIWSSPEVRQNLKNFFRLRRAMAKAKSGEERVNLGRASDEVWSPEKVKDMAAVLYQRFKGN
jgi:tetratricopeptide (TPR) repeat protein